MLGDMLLATLQICGIVIAVGFTAAIVGSLIDFFLDNKKK